MLILLLWSAFVLSFINTISIQNYLVNIMCLCPVTIYNPKIRFSMVGGTPMKLRVPCGKCSECQQQKVDEYAIRSHYEAYDCFLSGGFIINDTLTYRPADLPRFSMYDPQFEHSSLDFPCFCQRDFRLFMVRLRERCSNLGLDAGKIKYFMASEYGTSQFHRHQPHYHVLFYVYDNKISPDTFSYLISDCWQYGRTDGIKYNGRSYFFNKRCFSMRSNNDLVHLSNVVRYVTKYLAKDTTFQNTIDSRINAIMTTKFGSEWRSDKLAKHYRQTLDRQISQFHRQSQGFGISALKYNSITDVLDTGMLQMSISKNVCKHVPLPMYFKRKLFYTLDKDFRGKPVWNLTNFGVQYRLNRASKSIQYLSNTFKDWYSNLSLFNNDYNNLLTRFDDFMAGRTFEDLAKYTLFYANRIIPKNIVDLSLSNIGCADLETPSLELMLTLPFETGYEVFHDKENDEIRFSLYDYLNPNIHSSVFHDFKDFIARYTINESTFKDFRNFDKCLNLIISSQIMRNSSKDDANKLISKLTNLFNSLFNDV